MCEIDNGVAAAKYILQGMAIHSGQDLCVTNASKKQRPVELQMELCARSGCPLIATGFLPRRQMRVPLKDTD
jgi:hypothetical protein